MRSGKMAFLDNLLSEGEISASVLAAVRRWLYLRRFRNAAYAVRALGRLGHRLQGLRIVALFFRLVRVRLRIHQVFTPLLNRVRARIHNAMIAKRAAAKTKVVQQEVARALHARQEAAMQEDRARQRQLDDARLAESAAQAELEERVVMLAQLHSMLSAQLQAVSSSLQQALADRDNEATARKEAEARVVALQTQSIRDTEAIIALRAQLADMKRDAQKQIAELEEEATGVRRELKAMESAAMLQAQQLLTVETELAQVRKDLQEMKTERDSMVQKLNAQAEHVLQLEKAMEATEVRAASASAALAEAQMEIDRERNAVAQAGTDAQHEKQRADKEMSLARAQLDDVRAQVMALQSKLDLAGGLAKQQAAEGEGRLAAQASIVASLRERNETLERQLSALEMERGDLIRTAFVCQEAQTKVCIE